MLALSCPAQPGDGGDPASAIRELDSALGELNAIRPSLHYQDEGRLYVLEQSVKDTRDGVASKGLLHLAVRNLYTRMLDRFRYSDGFFTFVRTRRNEISIRALLTTILSIRKSVGVDTEPSSKRLEAHFLQLHGSLSELMKQDGVSAELRASLQGADRKLADAIAVASLGDTAKAIRKAREIHLIVRALYPGLHHLAAMNPAFGLTLEIIGVNEFLGAFSLDEGENH